MRTCVVLFIALAMFNGQLVRAADEAAAPKRNYVVQCRVMARGQGRDSLTFAPPKLTVDDGEKSVAHDITERPFVVGVKTSGDVQTPVIQVLKEGTTIEFTVTGTGENEALVDVSVDFAGTIQPEVKKDRRGNDYQAIHQSGLRGRAIESVTLGKKATLRLSDKLPRLDVELTVTAAPDAAAVAAAH